MDIIFRLKEDQKNNITEPNYKKKSNSIDKINVKNKLEYSKKLQRKHLINIQKLFSKEKNNPSYSSISKFPLFNLNISKNNSIRLRDSGHSYIYTLKREDQIEKEKIINQIFIIEDEINKKNEEIEEYKNFYKKLEDHNLTFKAIIERILNIEDNDEKDIENNGKIVKNDNNIKSISKDINSKISKNENNPKNLNSEKNLAKIKINRLKLQVKNYDKTIVEKEKFLDKTKNNKKIGEFIIFNKLLNEKNRELEELVNGGQKLQFSQHEMDRKVDFYFAAIKNYRENYNKLQDKLKINEKELNYNKNEIDSHENDIVDCYIKIEKLEEELKILEDINNKKKEKIEKIKEEYENNKDIKKEKEIIEKDLENIYNKVYTIKKVIEKNNRNIIRIKYENEEYLNDISILKVESEKLNEKVKDTQKSKINLKNFEKEIKQTKEEININKLKYEKILNKEREDKERIKKEIEEFERAKTGLINKINELTKELKEKTEENNIKEEELTKANEEYNNVMKDKKSYN